MVGAIKDWKEIFRCRLSRKKLVSNNVYKTVCVSYVLKYLKKRFFCLSKDLKDNKYEIVTICRLLGKATCKKKIALHLIRKLLQFPFADNVSVIILIQHFLKDRRRKKNLRVSIKLYSLAHREGKIRKILF